MKITILALALALTSISASSYSGGVYTCTKNGSTVYQGTPCIGSKELADKVNKAKEIERNKQIARSQYESEYQRKLSSPEPSIGMSMASVKNSSWGAPDSVNKTVTSRGESEQWVYRGTGFVKTKYLYFTNGIMTSAQY